MIVAVDIGNTDTVTGVFRGRKLIATYRVRTQALSGREGVAGVFRFIRRKTKSVYRENVQVVIASVVPRCTARLRHAFRESYNIRPLIVDWQLDHGLKLHYRKPEALGADRLCNAVAAYERCKGAAIVVDFGTATKYEAVSRRGEYLGGAIDLGVGSKTSELHRRTAKLPRVPLHFPKRTIGTDTVSSLQIGILLGSIDAMEGMVKRLKKRLGRRAKVVATGGFSGLIARHSDLIDIVEPHLVLVGARIICERVMPV